MIFVIIVTFALAIPIIAVPIFIVITLLEWNSTKDNAVRIPFKTFVKFYNIAPNRWVLKDAHVQKLFKEKNNYYFTSDSRKDFYFSYVDYIKYNIWHWQIQKEEARNEENRILAELIEEVKKDLDDFNKKGWK